MNKPSISVIVPVYNVERYLPRCIDSILAQTFTDFELLLIDDGSTDCSGRICDEYARRDNRVHVFHKKNEGVSATREFGVQKANGIYIQFIDSDDWIEANMFEEMLNAALMNDIDIVGCTFYEDSNKGTLLKRTYYESSESFIRAIIKSYWAVVWKLLVKKELFVKNDIHFPQDINGGEDYVVCVKLFIHAESILSIDKALYHYNRCNDHSIMSHYSRQNVQYQINATSIIENYLIKKGLFQDYEYELNMRKFQSKFPLLKRNQKEWLQIFPECNKLYKQIPIGWKSKCFIFLLLILNRFMDSKGVV